MPKIEQGSILLHVQNNTHAYIKRLIDTAGSKIDVLLITMSIVTINTKGLPASWTDLYRQETHSQREPPFWIRKVGEHF